MLQQFGIVAFSGVILKRKHYVMKTLTQGAVKLVLYSMNVQHEDIFHHENINDRQSNLLFTTLKQSCNMTSAYATIQYYFQRQSVTVMSLELKGIQFCKTTFLLCYCAFYTDDDGLNIFRLSKTQAEQIVGPVPNFIET